MGVGVNRIGVVDLSGSTAPFVVAMPDGPFSIDGFSVDQTITLNVGGAPEPANWAMLVAGFGLTEAQMRRRQANSVVA